VDDDTVQEEEDPRSELIRRLIEYKKYKEASTLFENMEQMAEMYSHGRLDEPDSAEPDPDDEIVEMRFLAYLKLFVMCLQKAPKNSFHEVLP